MEQTINHKNKQIIEQKFKQKTIENENLLLEKSNRDSMNHKHSTNKNAKTDEFERFYVKETSNLKQPTIYYFLKENHVSETHIKNLRKNPNSIKLNGFNATTRTKIKHNDIIDILSNAKEATKTNLCNGKLHILFEDKDFLIINKPHNLDCIPNRSHYTNNLGGQVCKYMQSKDKNFVLRILNRLDKETAGIVVVAKNTFAYNSLVSENNKGLEKMQTTHKIYKKYFALISGNLHENGTIDKPILTITKDGINQMKRVVSLQGKSAVTHYEVIANYPVLDNNQTESSPDMQNKNQNSCQSENFITNNFSSKQTNITDTTEPFCLISLTLETGRTHQIRVHLSSIGHPLLGDTIYGDKPALSFKTNHTMLVLKSISFTHFRTGEKINIEIPFPQEWQLFLNHIK